VCPVNPDLDFRSGLARIVSGSAGKQTRSQRPLCPEPYGKVIVLPGGQLRVKYVFLTVLLGERGVDKIRLSIRQSVERAIRYAEFLRLKTIAFPVLGSASEALPYSFVAREMLENVTQYYQRRNTKLKAILFSAFNADAFEALKREAKSIAIL
jgi:O-acetyl-ADP-ribose deacetylase (regulator of RNase III)